MNEAKIATGEKMVNVFAKIIFRAILPTQEKLLPRASRSIFTHPRRQNIIDVCPSYADVFSWWMGFADVTRGDEALADMRAGLG